MLLALQEADKKGSVQPQSSAASSTPPAQRSYADLLRSAQAANAPSGSAPPSGRPQTPSQPSAAAPSPAAQSPSPAVPAPPKASGNRSQGRNAPAAAAAGSASSDTSARGEQARGNFPALDRPALRPAGSDGPPPARPPYAAPGRGVQGYRDDDSSKKAVYVRNIPQVCSAPEKLLQKQRLLCVQYAKLSCANTCSIWALQQPLSSSSSWRPARTFAAVLRLLGDTICLSPGPRLVAALYWCPRCHSCSHDLHTCTCLVFLSNHFPLPCLKTAWPATAGCNIR